MGRELKRVSFDFEWPLNLIWKGFLNPYIPTDCKQCEGSGLNERTKQLDNDWYTHCRTDGKEGWGLHLEQEDVQALVDGGRLWDFTRTPRTDEQKETVKKEREAGRNGWLPSDNGYIPTAEEVNEWSKKGIGHDSINKWICVEARAKRLGFYGKCTFCKGAGHYWCDDKYEALWEGFKDIQPPEGNGYQIWETVSEGSPISPVFETPELLAKHMAGTRWGADDGTPYEIWLKFIMGPGWAPSLIGSTKDGIRSGVQAITEAQEVEGRDET